MPYRGRSVFKPNPGVQINRSHPLAQGLRYFTLFNDAGLVTRDIAGGNPEMSLSGANVSRIGTNDGAAVSTTTDTSFLGTLAASSRWQPTKSITVMLKTTYTSGQFWFTCEGATPSGFGIYNSTDPHPYMRTDLAGGTWSDPGGMPAVTSGQRLVIWFTYDGANHRAGIDRTLGFTNAITGNIVYDATQTLVMNADRGSANGSTMTDEWMLISERPFSMDMINQMIASPYQFMRPERRYWLFGVTAAGGAGIPFFMQTDLKVGQTQALTGNFQ